MLNAISIPAASPAGGSTRQRGSSVAAKTLCGALMFSMSHTPSLAINSLTVSWIAPESSRHHPPDLVIKVFVPSPLLIVWDSSRTGAAETSCTSVANANKIVKTNKIMVRLVIGSPALYCGATAPYSACYTPLGSIQLLQLA